MPARSAASAGASMTEGDDQPDEDSEQQEHEDASPGHERCLTPRDRARIWVSIGSIRGLKRRSPKDKQNFPTPLFYVPIRFTPSPPQHLLGQLGGRKHMEHEPNSFIPVPDPRPQPPRPCSTPHGAPLSRLRDDAESP